MKINKILYPTLLFIISFLSLYTCDANNNGDSKANARKLVDKYFKDASCRAVVKGVYTRDDTAPNDPKKNGCIGSDNDCYSPCLTAPNFDRVRPGTTGYGIKHLNGESIREDIVVIDIREIDASLYNINKLSIENDIYELIVFDEELQKSYKIHFSVR